jgi:GST-like protein
MIDFYALTSPNVQKIFIMLEELGLPYTLHPVDVWKGEQFSPEFLNINPNAKIPDQSQREDPGDRRSRGAGRQALYGLRIRRDPALSRREDG